MSDEPRQPQLSETDACPPEWMLSVYDDRELEAHEMHRIDTHLVRCRACREIVVALRDEASVLRTALSFDEVEAVAVAPSLASATESLGFGAGTAVATLVAALVAFAWLSTLPLPAALGWLNPFDLGGLIALFFDTISLLRERAPALYQFSMAATALLSSAFLLTSSVTLATRRILQDRAAALWLPLCVLGLATATPSPSSAIELLFESESAQVAKGEVVEQTWVTTARSVDIAGTLRGDLVAFGDRVVVSGVLDGNLVTGARRVEIEGRVTGSVVTFGERVRITGTVDGNAYSAAGQTTLTDSARIGRDLAVLGDGLSISGAVERDLLAYLEWIEVRGEIGRNLIAAVEEADILSTASVGADLRLMHREEAEQIVLDDAAKVEGETSVVPESHEVEGALDHFATFEFYGFFVLSLAAAFLTGLLLYRIAPWIFGSTLQTGADLMQPLGYGFIIVFAGPIAMVLLAFTIVGIPIALAGLAALVACFYSAKIVVGAALGTLLLGPPAEAHWREFALPLIVGLGLVFVATEIPYLGGLLGFLVLLVGSGAVALRVRGRFHA